MSKSIWPKYVPIPDAVGIGNWEDGRGYPVCAMGHAGCAFRGRKKVGCVEETAASVPDEWKEAYRCCYYTSRKRDVALSLGVTHINDIFAASPEERRLLYLSAWAYCGYTEGMPKDALALAKRTEKRFGPLFEEGCAQC